VFAWFLWKSRALKSRNPKLLVLLTVGQMLPDAVSRLLLFTVRTRRIVDALSVASGTANAVLEGVDCGGGDARQGDAESRGQADDDWFAAC
jgi:hypothetical protein